MARSRRVGLPLLLFDARDGGGMIWGVSAMGGVLAASTQLVRRWPRPK